MTTHAAETQTRPVSAGCPVTHTDYRVDRPIFDTYANLNAERERNGFLLNTSTDVPFYMVQRFEHVLEAIFKALGAALGQACRPAYGGD